MSEKIEQKDSIDNRTTYRPTKSISLALTPATMQYNKAIETVNKLGELTAFTRRMEEYKNTLGIAEKTLQQNYARLKEIKDSNPLVRTVGYFTVKKLEKDNIDLKQQVESYKNDIHLFNTVDLPKEVAATSKQLEKILPDDKLRDQITKEVNTKLMLQPGTNEKLHEFYAKKERDDATREMDEYAFMNSARLPEGM